MTGPEGTTSTEVELKLLPRTRAAADRVLAADGLAGLMALAPARTTRMEDGYVDTADAAVARGGFAARLRRTGRRTIVSLKSTRRRRGAGPHRREELEGPAGPTLDPRDWPPSAARSLLLELADGAPLAEQLTIRQARRRRRFGDASTTVEVSLDDVAVVVSGRVVDRWLELEVELVGGDEARLLLIAAELARAGDLVDAPQSKLERALAARDAAAARR